MRTAFAVVIALWLVGAATTALIDAVDRTMNPRPTAPTFRGAFKQGFLEGAATFAWPWRLVDWFRTPTPGGPDGR